jgi:hypothetical protein
MLFKRWKTTPGPEGTWHPAPSGARLHTRIADRLQLQLRRARFLSANLFWLRQLELELRSLCGRIRIVWRTRKDRAAIDLGRTYDVQGEYLQWSLETLVNSACIRSVESSFPWASDVDCRVALEGVRLGRALAPCIQDTSGDRWREACANLSNRDMIIEEMIAAMQPDASRRGGLAVSQPACEKCKELAKLLLEARDALPAISVVSARLRGVDLSLADRIEAALEPWRIT